MVRCFERGKMVLQRRVFGSQENKTKQNKQRDNKKERTLIRAIVPYWFSSFGSWGFQKKIEKWITLVVVVVVLLLLLLLEKTTATTELCVGLVLCCAVLCTCVCVQGPSTFTRRVSKVVSRVTPLGIFFCSLKKCKDQGSYFFFIYKLEILI